MFLVPPVNCKLGKKWGVFLKQMHKEFVGKKTHLVEGQPPERDEHKRKGCLFSTPAYSFP